MLFCDEILPPKTVTFLKSLNDDEQDKPALKQIGLTGDLPQVEQQAQGAAAFPDGNNIYQGE
jgi:hypothetical protein